MREKQHYALTVCSRGGCSQRIIVSLSSSQRATCPRCGNRVPLKILMRPEHLLLSLDTLPMLRAMAGPPWASVLPGKPFWVWDRKCGNIPSLNFSFQQLTPGALRARVDDCSLEELPGIVHRYLLLLDCDGHDDCERVVAKPPEGQPSPESDKEHRAKRGAVKKFGDTVATSEHRWVVV